MHGPPRRQASHADALRTTAGNYSEQMADFSRYLPLSNREPRDESAVTNDWSAHLAATLAATAEAVRSLADAQWRGASVQPDVMVADLITTEIGDLTARDHIALVPASPRDAADALDRLAAAARETTRRTRLAALTTAVVAATDLATATGVDIRIDAIATGAVAVARSLRAPIGIRAVLRDNRFVAVDAEWSVGSGPIHSSTAAAILLFLFARTGLPAAPETP